MIPRPTLVPAIVVALAALGAAVASPPPAAGSTTATLGQPAPAFTLTDIKGRERSLADYKGRTVVIEWTDPKCPYVRRHARTGTMRRAYAAVRAIDQSVVWLAVNSRAGATARANGAWAEAQRIPYPILLDPDGAVGHRYDARTSLHMFVIDKEGVLRYHGAIDDNRLGNKPEHEVTNYVVNAVRCLAAGQAVTPDHERPYGCTIKYRR